MARLVVKPAAHIVPLVEAVDDAGSLADESTRTLVRGCPGEPRRGLALVLELRQLCYHTASSGLILGPDGGADLE